MAFHEIKMNNQSFATRALTKCLVKIPLPVVAFVSVYGLILLYLAAPSWAWHAVLASTLGLVALYSIIAGQGSETAVGGVLALLMAAGIGLLAYADATSWSGSRSRGDAYIEDGQLYERAVMACGATLVSQPQGFGARGQSWRDRTQATLELCRKAKGLDKS